MTFSPPPDRYGTLFVDVDAFEDMGAKRMDALIEDLLSFGKVCVVDVPNTFVNLNTVVGVVLRKWQVSYILPTKSSALLKATNLLSMSLVGVWMTSCN